MHDRDRALSHGYGAGGTGPQRRALLRHPRGRGVGQHPLHSGTGRAGAPDPRRMFRFAGTAQRGVARDYQPLLGRNARWRGTVQDIRHQPAPGLLYQGNHLRVDAQVQHPEDKRRGAGHHQPHVRLSGHRPAGQVLDSPCQV